VMRQISVIRAPRCDIAGPRTSSSQRTVAHSRAVMAAGSVHSRHCWSPVQAGECLGRALSAAERNRIGLEGIARETRGRYGTRRKR
jgi:hypothetical protein